MKHAGIVRQLVEGRAHPRAPVPAQVSPPPTPVRYHHNLNAVDGRIYMFGGYTGKGARGIGDGAGVRGGEGEGRLRMEGSRAKLRARAAAAGAAGWAREGLGGAGGGWAGEGLGVRDSRRLIAGTQGIIPVVRRECARPGRFSTRMPVPE